jgi:hypothetical protein
MINPDIIRKTHGSELSLNKILKELNLIVSSERILTIFFSFGNISCIPVIAGSVIYDI